MAAFGFEAADFEEEAADVWPCCWPAVSLLLDMGTQWRVSMAGVCGLDYAALAAVMDMQGVPRKKRAGLLSDVQILEREALTIFAEKQHGKQ